MNNKDNLEIRFIKEGGKYKMYELDKKMIINNGNIFFNDKNFTFDYNGPHMNLKGDHMTIREAYEFCKKKHDQ